MLQAGRFALVPFALSLGIAFAGPQKLGPIEVVVRVNSIEVPLTLTGAMDLNTSKSDFNATGELTVSSDVTKFTDEAKSILKSLVPLKFDLSDRELIIEEISSLEFFPHDYQIDIRAKAIASIGTTWFERQKEVELKLEIIPQVTNGKKLGWRILREPKLQLPTLWWAAMEINGRHPNKIAGVAIQKWLNENASFDLPSISGIRASFQGANFDGDSKTVAFRIKGDAHVDGVGLTSVIGNLMKGVDLDFAIRWPPKGKTY